MKNKNYLLTSLIIAGLMASCAKERELDTVYKAPELESTSAINTEAEFLYVPTSHGVPRFTKAMKPFVQGREKIVKFKFEEEGIVAYEMESNGEFQDNILNNKPILTIPVTYKSYRCAENADKECTNREEENNELEWFQKDNFVPNFEDVKVLEADSLGLPENNDPCYSLQSTKLVDYQVSKTDLHFEIEKTYKFSNTQACQNELWYSSGREYDKFLEALDDNGAFNTRVFFSFAKLDTIASKNYKEIDYPVQEHSTFGFFKTKEREKNSFGQMERTYKLNRWNPEKSVVEYYLSDEFDKKENKYLKDATIFAFNRMNTILEKNKVNLRLKLNMPSNKRPGNLRNTMIVLIEDLASGLLGYGPTVANPRTGEIVKGHTNMYKGSLESIAPSAYDSIVYLERQLKKEAVNAAAIKNSLKEESKDENINAKSLTKAVKRLMNSQENSLAKSNTDHNHTHAPVRVERNSGDLMAAARNFEDFKKSINKKESRSYQELVLSKVNGELNDYTKEMKEDLEMKDLLHRNSVYTVDMFNFQSLGKVSLDDINQVDGIRNDNGELKDWIDLNESQQDALIKILARHAYIPTLVHEVGHNLGLRHNFRGSLDGENFYNEEERAELGIKSGSVFSSIMDYTYSSLNELSTFGKYDIAALRFGYNREVEVKGGDSDKISIVSLETPSIDGKSIIKKSVNQIENRVEYKFCTDEDVSMYSDCNRFDEGTNTLEMTKHYAQKYNEYYQWRNMKNRSKNFNDGFGTWRYYLGTYYSLLDLRKAHETWQFYKTYLEGFGLERIMDTKCTEEDHAEMPEFCITLDQVVEANDVATRTLLDIIKTPDLTCDVEYTKYNGDKELFFVHRVARNLSEATKFKSYPLQNGEGEYRATSCFDQNVWSDIVNDQDAFNQVNQACIANLSEEKCLDDKNSLRASIVGQVGKFHNDVDAAKRDDERLESDDIEIRGNWIDKILATEILTNRDRLTTAGESIHASFTDMPKYSAEIYNIFQHLALNKTLQAPLLAERPNGELYQMPFETTLHVGTKVPTYKRLLKRFIPFPDTKDFDIAQAILRTAAINSEVDENDATTYSDYLTRSTFNKSISVIRRSNISSNIGFGEAVKTTTSTPDYMFGATERNTLAAEVIARVNGATKGITAQIIELMKKLSATEEGAEQEVSKEAQRKVIELISLKQNAANNQATLDRLLAILMTNTENTPEQQEYVKRKIAELKQELGADIFNPAEEVFVKLSQLMNEHPALAELGQFELYDLKFTMSDEETQKEILKKEVDALWNLPVAN